MVDLRKNRVVFSLVLVTIALTIFQLMLFMVYPDTNTRQYWDLHDTSTDFIELTLILALCTSIPYTAVRLKMTTACLVVWQLYCAALQIITDYIQSPIDDVLGGIFITVFIGLIFSARFLFNWSPNKTKFEPGCFYELTGKPTNLSQLIVAGYSGRGGSFGVTDGEHLWHYSKQHDSMVCEVLRPYYPTGRMIKKICATSEEKYTELNTMCGQKFTFMHNCLELHALAGKWR